MVRSIGKLFVSFLVIGLFTLSIPRVTPPGGLVGFDFLLMCSLPIGAYSAGKHWHNDPVFLLYGAFGTLTFVPGYLADGRLGLRFAHGYSTIAGEFVAWTVGVLCVSMVCNLAGKAANEGSQH